MRNGPLTPTAPLFLSVKVTKPLGEKPSPVAARSGEFAVVRTSALAVAAIKSRAANESLNMRCLLGFDEESPQFPPRYLGDPQGGVEVQSVRVGFQLRLSSSRTAARISASMRSLGRPEARFISSRSSRAAIGTVSLP